MVDLTVVERLLGVPPGYPNWRVAHLAARARLLPTWLSTLRARGEPLTPAALAHLERTERNVAALHAVGEQQATTHGVTVIKGPRIAAHYPPGVLRQSGDADLVAPDEQALWACVLDLRDRHGAVPQGVNLLQSDHEVHLVVAMKWPAADPLLDKPLGADISTCAFSGDARRVPVRAAVLADDDLCSLFAVAEERFQRSYRAKDLMDLVVLAEVLDRRFGTALPELVVEHATALCLAPELRKLITQVTDWVDLPPVWDHIVEALRPVARDEKTARHTRSGLPRLRFGFPLPVEPPPAPALRIHPFDGGELAHTPLGVSLLVDSPTIDEDHYLAALTAADDLALGTPE